jgi:hypothetical protein
MPRIFQKWPLNLNMLHIVYQHSWKFNLETLFMSRIFSKWPHSWKMLSTIYQYSIRINLIGNFHNSIYFLKNPIETQLQMSCNWKLLVKKGGFSTSVGFSINLTSQLTTQTMPRWVKIMAYISDLSTSL